MPVQAILDECDGVSIGFRKTVFISVVSYPKQSGQEVILKAREEVL